MPAFAGVMEKERIVPAHSPSWPIVDILTTTCALLILLMAGREWRQMRTPGYRRVALAAGAVTAARLLLTLLEATGLFPGAAPVKDAVEGALQGGALALLAWAFFHPLLASPRGARWLLALGLGGVGLGLALGLRLLAQGFGAGWVAAPGFAVLLLLSGWAAGQWARRRGQLLPWLGAAWILSALGAMAGLAGLGQAASWFHLAALFLLMVATYRTILADWGAYGQGLQSASERTLRQSQEMALLMEVNQAVSASLELPVVLEHACESLARSVAADWAYILLPLEDSSETFQVAARYGWWGRRQKQDTQVHRQVIVRLGDFSLLRHAVLRRRMVLANEPRDYEQFDRLHDLLGRPQGGPTLIVPIFHQDRSIGVALLGYVEKQHSFSQADSRLCQALVSQVAAAITNARAFHVVDERASQLEKALQEEQEQRLLAQAIFNSLAGGVVVVGPSGDLILANRAAEGLLGLPRAEMDRRVWRRLESEFARPGQDRPAEQAVFGWNDRVLAAGLAPVKIGEKGAEGQAYLLCDVTALHHSRQALEQAIAGVAGELDAALSLFKEGGTDPGRGEKIRREALDFLLDLQALAAPHAPAASARTQAASVSDLVKGALGDIGLRAAAHSVSLVTKIAADLLPVDADPHALRRALAHLLEHAVQATPPGGRVDVWAAEARLEDADHALQDYIVLTIRDSGSGLTGGEVERLLDPFFRTGPVPPDQGAQPRIQVALARALVESQGGRMWVESEVGKGTLIRFSVPASAG